jgi:cephalosporin-C deacetylase-like acetyl esterase
MTRSRIFSCAGAIATALAGTAIAQSPDPADALRKLDVRVLGPEEQKAAGKLLGDDLRARRTAANQRETAEWSGIANKADWERYRDARIGALRKAVGEFPAPPRDLNVRVTRTLEGEGFKIENVVFESRKDVLVTANLYSPANPPASMPVFLIIHSHHNPKTQAELQDMGMLWARAGCLVLVPDQLGHGERRQHPFRRAEDWPTPYPVGRQDYFHRYMTGMQLHAIGDSLIGWMAYDMSRCLDLLLARPGADPKRVALLGSVAGGGDPCGVAAALDARFNCVVPFNFGGPQPETTYPLPTGEDAAFNFAGGGSWESTRNISFSCRDGFLPWVIVGSVAPRRLIHAHEFAWDRERDPVWRRYRKIFGFYNAPADLSFTHGYGTLSGRPPQASHCNNIGEPHRKSIHEALEKWFGIKAEEYKNRRPAEDLLCLTAEIKPRPMFEVARAAADERIARARAELSAAPADKRLGRLRQRWAEALGIQVGVLKPGAVKERSIAPLGSAAVVVSLELNSERGLVVPTVLLLPKRDGAKLPVVVAVAQDGKQRFLRERAEAVAELLGAGVAVCLADVRGTGETSLGDNGGGRRAAGVSASSMSLMLGQPLLGGRLNDVRCVLAYVKGRADVDRTRVAVWGDSFAPVNAPDREFEVPADDPKYPAVSQPAGALLALLAGLFDDDVKAVYAAGGLTGYRALVEQRFVYVPHDVIVPGALPAGDLGEVVKALSTRSVRIAAATDGLNRRVSAEALRATWADAAGAAGGRLVLETDAPAGKTLAAWLVGALK